MVNDTVDIAQLTEAQQLALQQFTSVTDQELSAAVPLLQLCDWNVQIAIARFFDGEPQDAGPEISSNNLLPQPRRRQEVLQSQFSTVRPPRTLFEPAPRVSPQSETQINPRPPFLLSLVLTPANIIYTLLSRIFGLFSYLFPSLPRLLARITSRANMPSSQLNGDGRRPLPPQDTTARFLREFEEEYGAHTLPMLETGYARAFDMAKRELKFLLVVPLSTEHDDTATFVRTLLLAESVTTFLNNPSNNILLWAGSVQDSEGYQVASSLNISKFPSAVLIAHTPSISSTAMSVVMRITGPVSPQQFIAGLQSAIMQHGQALNGARAARIEQQATRSLRDQQNSAYERSLAADRERAQQKRDEEARKQMQEKDAVRRIKAKETYATNLKHWRRWRLRKLYAEPGPEEKDAVRISIRMPDGNRVMRKFKADSSIEEVYAFVECYEYIRVEQQEGLREKEVERPQDFTHEYKFRLVSPMPREVYAYDNGGTVKEKIGRNGNLIVENVEEDVEDNAELVNGFSRA